MQISPIGSGTIGRRDLAGEGDLEEGSVLLGVGFGRLRTTALEDVHLCSITGVKSTHTLSSTPIIDGPYIWTNVQAKKACSISNWADGLSVSKSNLLIDTLVWVTD